MSIQATLPRILQIGSGASLALAETLATLGCSRPLLVTTDKMMVELGYSAR